MGDRVALAMRRLRAELYHQEPDATTIFGESMRQVRMIYFAYNRIPSI